MSKKFLESGVHVSSNREFVETLYKNWAETYDQEIKKNLYSTPNRIASILAQTESNKGIKVLDYGCGTGLSGLALKKVGFRNLVGIDPSDEMLQKAEEKKIYKSLINLNLDNPIPIKKGEYSIIIGSGLIGPGAASIELFDTIVSLLNTGGSFLFSLNDKALSIPCYPKKLNNYIQEKKGKIVFKEYGPHLPGIGLKAMIYLLEKK
ncbi:MAG: class I SAM-dependent DNA methyltransferase [Paracoccaceae bacterium]